jgi:DNA-binding MarR family transcriptional regulator
MLAHGPQTMISKPTKTRMREEHVGMTAFLHEIVAVADRLREARAFDGQAALRFDREWQLLAAIERCGGAPTFADLGRFLGVSRQAARTFALEAAERGTVELFAGVDDRRVWQVMLTARGRNVLETSRLPNLVWTLTLLNGLEPAAMRETTHVLSVVRRRLERYAREQRGARGARQTGIRSPLTNAMRPRTCR